MLKWQVDPRVRIQKVTEKASEVVKKRVATVHEKKVDVFYNPHEVDVDEVKEQYNKLFEDHYDRLLLIAMNYIAISSALEVVCSDMRETLASDFASVDVTEPLNSSVDRTISLYIEQSFMNLLKVDNGTLSELINSIKNMKTTNKPNDDKVKELMDSIGYAIKNGAASAPTDPYLSSRTDSK